VGKRRGAWWRAAEPSPTAATAVLPLQTSQAESEDNLAASVKSLAFGMAGGPQEGGAGQQGWSLATGEPGAEQYEQYGDQYGQYYDDGEARGRWGSCYQGLALQPAQCGPYQPAGLCGQPLS
jgi:hypothetical protein